MTTGFNEGSGLIGKWITNKNTLEYLGVWEKINNPVFNYTEFGVIGREANLLNVALFGITAKEWRDNNLDKTEISGTIQLNKVAITQMKSLLESNILKTLK